MFKVHLYVDEGGAFGVPRFFAYSRLYYWWHKKKILEQFAEWGGVIYLGYMPLELAQTKVDEHMAMLYSRCGWDQGLYVEYYNGRNITNAG